VKANQILKELMVKQNVGSTKMADRIGGKCVVRTISDRLRQENISIDKLNEMLRVLDYKIVVMPSSTKLPKDSYEVE